ncbi:MAG: sigma-70 family RNA polymerase sigma factor [Lactobacillales bacterium]|nr:sigma-70 family RNA polymerase sigma factor [Lactobacillales bacterium]
MSDKTDNELMQEVTEGSHPAFGALVERHTKTCYGVAYRYLSDKTLAEDMTQQAFLKVWEFPYKYDPAKGAAFKTWLVQILINLCIDHKRKNKHPHEDIADLPLMAPDQSADTKLYGQQMKKMLEKGINQLPQTQQTALNLGFYQEIPYGEVAEIMKTTASSVKSLIMRAKENLKKFLKENQYVD